MNQEYLSQASLKADLSIAEPEEAEQFGHSCSTHNNVSHSQHAEEEVHRLMEAGVCLDDEQKRAVSH